MVSSVEWSQWLHFKLLGKIVNCFGFRSRKMNCDYRVAKTTISATKTGSAL